MKNRKLLALIKLVLVIFLSFLLSKILLWIYVQLFDGDNIVIVNKVIAVICIGIPIYVLGRLRGELAGNQ